MADPWFRPVFMLLSSCRGAVDPACDSFALSDWLGYRCCIPLVQYDQYEIIKCSIYGQFWFCFARGSTSVMNAWAIAGVARPRPVSLRKLPMVAAALIEPMNISREVPRNRAREAPLEAGQRRRAGPACAALSHLLCNLRGVRRCSFTSRTPGSALQRLAF